jgi:hypothetical protein
MTLAECIAALDGKPALTADDALAARRIVFGGDVVVSFEETEALFKLNADAGAVSPEWRSFFIEALTDFIVRQQKPEGYVDQAKADWLMASVRKEQHVREDEVEMLIHVLEEADQTLVGLSTFILGLVKSFALTRFKRDGRLADQDIERLRRVVFAAGGEKNVAVSQEEAELLFDINDALAGAVANPVWTDFFVRAVASSVLFETPWTPDAAGEVKREAWLEDTSIHPFRRLAGLASIHADGASATEGLREILRWDFNDHQADRDFAAEQALETNAERVNTDEAHWLIERIRKNGRFDANERALLAFIRENAGTIDPSLEDAGADLASEPEPRAQAETVADRPVFGHRKAPAA